MGATFWIATLLTKDHDSKLVLAIPTFFARGSVMAASSAMFIGTAMCYPTQMRATGHSFANLWGRGGCMVATYTDSLPLSVQFPLYIACNAVAAVTIFLNLKEFKTYEDTR